MLRYLTFALWEGAVSLWRARTLNFLSMGTIMFAMFVLGSFIMVGVNLEKITINWRDQIQFNVFLLDDVQQAQLDEMREIMDAALIVKSAEYISKEEARKRFGKDFGAYDEAVKALDESPFPASFQVELIRGAERASFLKLKDQLEQRPGVEEVYYDEEIFKRLDFFIQLIRAAGLFFGAIMILSSIFTISNVLKLTFFTRREEVDIMKLVGASRAYIRGPFIIEGVMIGLLGALLGVALAYMGFLFIQQYLADVNFLMANLDLAFLPFRWIMILLGAGALSGLLGSLFSLHKFLEEHISYH